MRRPSWFEQHPWMTFFLAGSAISGFAAAVRSCAPQRDVLPSIPSIQERGTYR